MLLNREGKVLVGQRLDSDARGLADAAGRARRGRGRRRTARCASSRRRPASPRDKVEIVARCPVELTYDLPDDLVGKMWKGKWRGQRQTWFLMRFLGEDEDVNIATAEPEFRAWKWAEPAELPAMIVPFKKKLYEDVLEAFAEWL